MEKQKIYYSESLAKILSKYLTKEKYGDFVPYLEEIFQRRAYEFSFSDELIEKEVLNFVRNVKKIRFVTKEEIGKDTYKGLYRPSNQEILLNKDFFSKNSKRIEDIGEDLFETLTHEVYHGINDYSDSYGEMGLAYYDENGKLNGSALDEVFVEVASNRTTMSRGVQEQESYRARTSGYSDITFVPNLIAASLGISEKQIISSGIKDRYSLMTEFYSRFSSDEVAEKAKEEIFDPLERSLDIIYNVLYDEYENNNMKKALLVGALSSLYNKVYELMNFQIQDDERQISDSYTSEILFRFKKIETIMHESLDDFKKMGNISTEDIKQIKNSIAVQRRKLAIKTTGIKILSEHGTQLELDEFEKANFEVKDGKIDYVRRLLREKYGIASRSVRLVELMELDDSEYREYINQEDFDNGLKWENTSISKSIQEVLTKHLTQENHEQERKQSDLPKVDKIIENQENNQIEEDNQNQENNQVKDLPNKPSSTSRHKDKGYLKKIVSTLKENWKKIVLGLKKQKSLPEPTEVSNSQQFNHINNSFNQYVVPRNELKTIEEVREESLQRYINRSEEISKSEPE